MISMSTKFTLGTGSSNKMNPKFVQILIPNFCRKHFTKLLYLGLVVSTLPLVVLTYGCKLSNWTCTGDVMGGVMMVYALTAFLPNLCLFFVLMIVLCGCFILDFSRINNIYKICFFLYIAATVWVIYLFVANDLQSLVYIFHEMVGIS